MSFYYPVFLTVLLTLLQCQLVFKFRIVQSLILCISFSLYIFFGLKDYDFVAYPILGNALFYVMTIGAFFNRPRFKYSLKYEGDD